MTPKRNGRPAVGTGRPYHQTHVTPRGSHRQPSAAMGAALWGFGADPGKAKPQPIGLGPMEGTGMAGSAQPLHLFSQSFQPFCITLKEMAP
jgi:hypothetical protein